ncbi:LY6G6F [Ovibos moschatus]
MAPARAAALPAAGPPVSPALPGLLRYCVPLTSAPLPVAVLFLLLFLCGLPQAEADSIQAIYVDLGEAPELPCPSPPALHGDEFLSWFRSPAAGSSTALVAHVQVARPSPDPGKPRRESRLKLLGNYSLWLEGPKGRRRRAVLVCCAGSALQVPELEGSQFSARAAEGSSCSVLLCPVTPARSLDAVTWQEGKGPVKGDVQSFWGDGATLLLVCPGEGLPEPRARKPGIILCLVPQDKGISFSLAASTDASPALYAPSANWDVAWILKLLLTVGQGFTIVVLGIMLWRQRAQGAHHRNASFPQFKPEIQAYENIHLAHLSILNLSFCFAKPAPKTR